MKFPNESMKTGWLVNLNRIPDEAHMITDQIMSLFHVRVRDALHNE